MNIGKSKIDKQGRITLPRTFLRGNNIKAGSYSVVFMPVYNSDNAIKIVFKYEADEA